MYLLKIKGVQNFSQNFKGVENFDRNTKGFEKIPDLQKKYSTRVPKVLKDPPLSDTNHLVVSV